MTAERRRPIARAVANRVAMMTHRWPRLALHASDLIAPRLHRLRRIPSADALRQVFDHLDSAGAAALRVQIMRGDLRRELVATWLRQSGRTGIRSLLLQNMALRLPPGPVIIATFHIGPVHALGAVLESHSAMLLPVLNTTAPTAAFYESVHVLRRGGMVLMTLDPAHATRIDVPFFRGTLRLARGAFALARTTGAPIVPLAARWVGTSIGVVAGEPLAARGEGDVERSLAVSAARWLEEYLRAHPGEISPRILELMKR